jgi:phosphate transport system substrate-binding protein
LAELKINFCHCLNQYFGEILSTAKIFRVAAAWVTAAAVASSLLSPVIAHAETYDPITGSGSTWSQNAFDQWRKNVAGVYGMTVNFSGTGSSAGRRDYIGGTVDYALSEIPFRSNPEDGSPPEVPPRGYAYIPAVAGGTALMYNLNIGGQRVTNLRLSGESIARIFSGAISNWNDPAIVADNPGLVMPSKGITPVARSDSSGSTAQFTLWMSKQYPSIWATGMTTQYPTIPNLKYQSGSSGVAGYVSQNYGDGAITYVEHSYALESGFPVAKVLNAAGYYVEPSANSVAVALSKAQIAPDLTQILDGAFNNTDPRSYPLSSYSYMIVPTETGGVFTVGKGKTLSTFAKYMLCEGQQQAADLGYSPLPMNLVIAGFAQVARIPGTAVPAFDPTTCNNPTFKPGDSPDTNHLLLSAPQPPESDKWGVLPSAPSNGLGIQLQAKIISVNDGLLSMSFPVGASALFAEPALENNFSVTRGTLPEITVQDDHVNSRPGWSLTINVSNFVNSTNSSIFIGNEFLVIEPFLISSKTEAEGQVLGPVQMAGAATYPQTFVEATGSDLNNGATPVAVGRTVVGGNLILKSPKYQPAGLYQSVATFTLISK